MWEFWEYVTREFSEWRLTLPPAERALLDEKMRAIERMGLSVGCLKGPLRGFRHLYKIRVQGPNVSLRPLLCRGPQNPNAEFTMLKPMVEVGDKDNPADAKPKAEARRREIVSDPARRVRYRVPQP